MTPSATDAPRDERLEAMERERSEILDDLARCYMRAAVDRVLREQTAEMKTPDWPGSQTGATLFNQAERSHADGIPPPG